MESVYFAVIMRTMIMSDLISRQAAINELRKMAICGIARFVGA